MTPPFVHSSGPIPARIMGVGEAPGADEERERRPFVGAAGAVLNHLLLEGAKIPRSSVFMTNTCRFRPSNNDITKFVSKAKPKDTNGWQYYKGMWVQPFVPQHVELLKREIEQVQPNVIMAFGNIALWALTGEMGITNWRGSVIPCTLAAREDGAPYKVIPIIHPAATFHQYSDRWLIAQDMRRVAKEALSPRLEEPTYDFLIRPSYEATIAWLKSLLSLLEKEKVVISLDIETKKAQIACLGIATSKSKAICIPFMSSDGSYWPSVEEEASIIELVVKILHHPNAECIGQNFLYDAQYLSRYWGVDPERLNLARDTMIVHHTCFPALEKGLDFLSSLYCDYHRYWKGEGKEWGSKVREDELWTYNCKDAVITYEVDEVLQKVAKALKKEAQVAEQMAAFRPTLRMMIRGVLTSDGRRTELKEEAQRGLEARLDWLQFVCGQPINPDSPKQLSSFFYTDLQIKPVFNRKTGAVTCNEEALKTIVQRQPLLTDIINTINDYRSLRTIKSTFIDAEPDGDKRMRCSYNIAGTSTFRYSSSTDAFGKGGNLQNLAKGTNSEIALYCKENGPQNFDALMERFKKDSSTEAEFYDAVDQLQESGAVSIHLNNGVRTVAYRFLAPNARLLYVPDPDWVLIEADQARADLQIVIWEADDSELKQMVREGVDIHSENARVIKKSRQIAKSFVHAVDYGITPRSAAVKFGMTVAETERTIRRWFEAHPGILRWHQRTRRMLELTHSVSNRFGYSITFFDRPESLLPEALAWQPQSTVGILTVKAIIALDRCLREVPVLMQTHDSVTMQAKKDNFPSCLPRIKALIENPVPYDDPLVIPWEYKYSATSYGEMKSWKEKVQ